MTPSQRRKAHVLIRKVCCNYEDGNCRLLDDGVGCVCVQSISPYGGVAKGYKGMANELLQKNRGILPLKGIERPHSPFL